jgi:hypothetical protein
MLAAGQYPGATAVPIVAVSWCFALGSEGQPQQEQWLRTVIARDMTCTK